MTAKPEVCVGAVIVEDDRLLLIERGRGAGRGQWSVPGGRVEPGETLAEALVREVAEETALDVTCGEFIGWVERIGADYHFVIMDFWAHSAQGPLSADSSEAAASLRSFKAVAGDDASDVAWVPLAELDGYDLVDGLKSFLSQHGVLT